MPVPRLVDRRRSCSATSHCSSVKFDSRSRDDLANALLTTVVGRRGRLRTCPLPTERLWPGVDGNCPEGAGEPGNRAASGSDGRAVADATERAVSAGCVELFHHGGDSELQKERARKAAGWG